MAKHAIVELEKEESEPFIAAHFQDDNDEEDGHIARRWDKEDYDVTEGTMSTTAHDDDDEDNDDDDNEEIIPAAPGLTDCCGTPVMSNTKKLFLLCIITFFAVYSPLEYYRTETPNAPPMIYADLTLQHETKNSPRPSSPNTDDLESFTVLSKPLQVFEERKKYHSVDALRKDLDENSGNAAKSNVDRKFILGYYSCPDMAGNLIHEYTVSLLLAIITNRTLLWDFEANGQQNHNERVDCDPILHTALWTPSYAEWKQVYRLPKPKTVSTGPSWRKDRANQKPATDGRFVPLEESWAVAAHPLIRPRKIWEMTKSFGLWRASDLILNQPRPYEDALQLFGWESDPRAEQVIDDLFVHGYSYLTGMLGDKAIEFTPNLMHSVRPYMLDDTILHEHLTIGVHLRHISTSLDGSHVEHEVECLDKLLDELRRTHPQRPCTVLLMADRQLTLDNFLAAARERNCSTRTVEHKEIIQVAQN